METKDREWDALTPEVLDKMEILSIIDLYVAGLKFGCVYALKLAFHEKAIMYGLSAENKISEGNVQGLYDTI